MDKLWTSRGKTIRENTLKFLTKEGTPGVMAAVPATTVSNVDDIFAGHTAKEQLERFFVDMFKRFGVCNLALLKQHFQVRQLEKNPANMLASINEEMFRTGLNAVADAVNSAYYRRSLNDPPLDRIRNVILEVFKKKMAIKKADARDACLKELNEDITTPVYLKVMHELAYCKGSVLWIFKSGNGNENMKA